MICYATKHGDTFDNIYGHPGQVRMCLGREPTDIYEIELVENEAGPYWGWQDTGKTDFILVYFEGAAFRMSFAYGVDVEVKKGKGRVVRLDAIDKGVHSHGATY